MDFHSKQPLPTSFLSFAGLAYDFAVVCMPDLQFSVIPKWTHFCWWNNYFIFRLIPEKDFSARSKYKQSFGKYIDKHVSVCVCTGFLHYTKVELFCEIFHKLKWPKVKKKLWWMYMKNYFSIPRSQKWSLIGFPDVLQHILLTDTQINRHKAGWS